MELVYHWASADELELLTRTRVETLRAANGLPDSADLSEVERQSRAYYRRALASGAHAALLVLDGGQVVGTGGVSFFEVMPTCCNPSGRKAYLMNLYTAPAYRRRGIARHVLELLVEACRERNVTAISLEATAMGRPLYEQFGFVSMKNEMELLEKEAVLNGSASGPISSLEAGQTEV